MIEKEKVQYHEDDRAQRLLNIFDIPAGQINVSHVSSTDHIVAWHKHDIQTDYWVCLKGAFKVGLAYPTSDGVDIRWEYLSDRDPSMIKIPPGVYHGYKALQPESIMLYYLTEKYNPEDEFPVPPGAFDEDWSITNK
jgi:dTDP-4-dehydrorhamnose 3,5-epimerase-like enzyme